MIEKVFEILSHHNPNPQTELCYTNHYTLLVAVVLSAQATDKSVNKATALLFRKVNTPQDMLDLGEDTLKSYIRTLNYYPTKAKNIIGLSQILVDKYGGEVPDHDLESLPGVGRKTSNVVLNVAFNKPTLAVDTHIHRVANRLGLVKTKNPEQTEIALLKIIPEKYIQNAHHWLILHGRYTCKARNPSCETCVLANICPRIF